MNLGAEKIVDLDVHVAESRRLLCGLTFDLSGPCRTVKAAGANPLERRIGPYCLRRVKD